MKHQTLLARAALFDDSRAQRGKENPGLRLPLHYEPV
jgi:hypothetical protein